jgi:hypothetical protein
LITGRVCAKQRLRYKKKFSDRYMEREEKQPILACKNYTLLIMRYQSEIMVNKLIAAKRIKRALLK